MFDFSDWRAYFEDLNKYQRENQILKNEQEELLKKNEELYQYNLVYFLKN